MIASTWPIWAQIMIGILGSAAVILIIMYCLWLYEQIQFKIIARKCRKEEKLEARMEQIAERAIKHYEWRKTLRVEKEG